MGLKAAIVRPFAKRAEQDINRWASHAVSDQEKLFHVLINRAKKTKFGRDHDFNFIRTHQDFIDRVQIRDYEALKPYVDQIKSGKNDILWPGKPRYFAKTSGTTSGVKYIPITRESIPNHINTARNALFNYFSKSGNGHFFDGKMIFLSGSPELEKIQGIPTGRLSGIINHLVPSWVKPNQQPSYKTNCIDDWEEKLENIVDETIKSDMRLISGIPPWVQMYYERLLERTGKTTIREIFPNYTIFVYGGVNFDPYRSKLESLVGERIDSLETYPASEGFIAFQDSWEEEGMLLNTNSGIFFEFVRANEIFSQDPRRYSLAEVEKGVNYALVLSSNAGLWGYNIGDTLTFTSLDPFRILVTGRIKHFISAFGEHVIGNEVETAMTEATNRLGIEVIEFTVAPQVNPPEGGTPYHEWFIEFAVEPGSITKLAEELDFHMSRQNIYYRDLIEGGILQKLKIRSMKPSTFRNYMKKLGKLGGQNKLPRLSNDRVIADSLTNSILV